MYARQVSMDLRPDTRTDFTHTIEWDILPLLRKQKGFQDELTLVSLDGRDALAISLWDNKDSADAYSRGAYSDATRILSKLVDGTPRVKNFEVANSSCHKIAAEQKAA